MTQKIIDAHLHWWDLENNYYPWLMDAKPDEGGLSGVESIAHTYLYDSYIQDMDGYAVQGFVHVQAEWDPSDPVGETKWLQGLVDNDKIGGKPLAIVGFADFSSTDVECILAGHCQYNTMRGIRQMINYLADTPALCWAHQDYMENPTWRKNIGLLKKYGLSFDPMCFSNHFVGLAQIAHDNPDVPIILEHTGMPYDHTDEGRRFWTDGLRKLAECDNTAIKISGLGNTISNWTEDSIRPYVLQAIDIFGTSRVCFASNAPTDKQFSTVGDIWRAFISITADFSTSEKDNMFMHNALRLYRLHI